MAQGFLFAEPSIAETGIWCELAPGIDPAQWAHVCRFIGRLDANQFDQVVKKVRMVERGQEGQAAEIFELRKIPLVSLGPSGIDGKYQRET